ncbi:MAG TPA: kelch repeat-containing protein [Planctomycetota bacterium]|nr:kelch repeat-containing protein [Planctomycetota bacterium]
MCFVRSITLSFTLVAVLPAQSLQLDASGGSLPGSLSLDLHPGLQPFDLAIVLTGFDPGPTPISRFDPGDPRSVQVGTSILGNSFLGLFGLDLHLRIGPLAVPATPALVDLQVFFQGITLPGSSTIVDRISNPHAVRLANAGAFRDRGVFFANDRAFATTLPRADGKWMVVGGGRGGLLAQVAWRTTEVYDEITDSFAFGPQLTTERSLHAQTRLNDGRWLITGGVDYLNDPQAACEVYDPATDSFSAVAPMLSPRMGHTATLLPDGRVFVTGGLQAMTVTPSPIYAIFDTTNTTEIYNPTTNTWAAGPNLRTPRVGHIAILRPDGRVVLCGGISWDDLIIIRLPAVRATTDVYNPATNSIAAGPQMATARSLIDAVALGNDRWLLAGGISSVSLSSPGTPTNAAEIYNAVTNTWSSAGAMATARGSQRSWALGGGRFLQAGGANGTILSPTPLAASEIYDSATNGWSTGPSLNYARAGAATFLVPTGQVQVFGGGTTGGVISANSEWYYF